jgi:DNA-binding CsgD family transcriptional regulator
MPVSGSRKELGLLQPPPPPATILGCVTMEQRERIELFAPDECADAQWASTPLALQYASLKGAVEASAKAIEDRRPGAASEIADLQRRAIASLEECALATARLAEALESASFRRPLNCDRASFRERTSQFFDCARQFVLALACCAEPEGAVSRQGAQSAPSPHDNFRDRVASLTPKQRCALGLLLIGLPNKMIAYELGVAESTVKAHVGAIIRKLQVRSRSQVIAATARMDRHNGFAFEIDSVPKACSPGSEPRRSS